MKHASVTLVVLALFTPAAFASCASGSETQVTGGGGMGGNDPTSTGTSLTTTTGTDTTTGSSGTATTGSGGNMCVAHCASDQECQTSCPSAGSSLNCCDTATGVCYVTGAATCPAPKPDGGMPPPPY